MYRFVDAAVIRATTVEQSFVDGLLWPDLSGSTVEHVTGWRCWLERVWAVEEFAAAVELASPVLARRVGEMCAGRVVREREVRRAVVSVLRYVLRAAGRATPFGLFAGVAPVQVGSSLVARHGADHRAVARVDAEWLTGVVARFEGCPGLRRRLVVVGNNLAFVRGGRLVVSCQQRPGASNGTEPAEVSVRHTTAVRTVMDTARAPIGVAEVADTLAARFPTTPGSVIEGMLAELVAQRMLVTCLRPPMTATDPVGHVVDALAGIGADELPECSQQLAQLRRIHAELAGHGQTTSPAQRRDLRASASRVMTDLSAAERAVAVDLRLDCRVVLPVAVAREAEAAAAALVRLTPHPAGPPAWQRYHGRFVERYGPGALVPLTQLVDADTGLGFPEGYRDQDRTPPTVLGLAERDTALLTLAQNAAMTQRIEVVLDEDLLAQVAVEDGAGGRVQPHTELTFRVHAATAAALERGEFELALTGVARAAGTTTGRFLDVLDTADRARMVTAYAGLPTVTEDAVPVQVSCPPLYPRTENVTRSPEILTHLLPLAEHRAPGDGVIALEDLAVTADAHRLCLVSMSRRCPVEPAVFSAVEFTHHAHPLARFLCEISTARAAACASFSWGAASRLPFLPRVRYRRTILSPARWTLTATTLPGPAASWPDWADAFAAWRRAFRVPGAVDLGGSDHRVRLDLDAAAHLHLVRAELDRAGTATLREAPPANGFGWIGGRAHEVVLPLAATAGPAPRPGWPGHTVGREHGHLPAVSDWLYVKLYGHPDRHTTILTTHLPTLLAGWDPPPQWWFQRYHDPDPHLRLRVRLPCVEEFGPAARRVGAWANDLRRLGLVGTVQLDTYYPETGRFGDGPAMTAAEAVFAADSVAAIAELTLATRPSAPHLHAILAASHVNLAASYTGDTGRGLRWLIEHLSSPSIPAPDRAVHDQAISLANPHDGWATLRGMPEGEHVVAVWAARRVALGAYREALRATGQGDPDAVLPDLLHLHHVRAAGISPDTEQVCRRLARAAALSWTTRTKDAP